MQPWMSDVPAAVVRVKAELRKRVPDVLVSDIAMPEQDGHTLIRAIRELPAERGGNIPAIALTAFASKEDRIHILAAGYQTHVPKPVEPDELATVAASLAGRMGRSALNGSASPTAE